MKLAATVADKPLFEQGDYSEVDDAFRDPSLLACRRVQVLDVRPVLDRGHSLEEVLEYYLKNFEDHRTLLVVLPDSPPEFNLPLEQYRLHHRTLPAPDGDVWWILYRGSEPELRTPEGPGASLVLPGGGGKRVVYLHCGGLESPAAEKWIRSVLGDLSEGDTLVCIESPWRGGDGGTHFGVTPVFRPGSGDGNRSLFYL